MQLFHTRITVFTQGCKYWSKELFEMSPVTCVSRVGDRVGWAVCCRVTSQGCSWARNSKKKTLSSLVRNRAERPGEGNSSAQTAASPLCWPPPKTKKFPGRIWKLLGSEVSRGDGTSNYSLPCLPGLSAACHLLCIKIWGGPGEAAHTVDHIYLVFSGKAVSFTQLWPLPSTLQCESTGKDPTQNP